MMIVIIIVRDGTCRPRILPRCSSVLRVQFCVCSFFFFFNDTATTEIYTLSLHDALPICRAGLFPLRMSACNCSRSSAFSRRSEEHTSELQSRQYLVCRLLLEKKKKKH